MRREGRQHGYVRTHIIISEASADTSADHQMRIVKKKLSGEPVAGAFAKVSRKPTNHSKFTGKCSKQMCMSCREPPASKAKNKSKGRRKFGLIMDDGLQAVVDVNDYATMDDERPLS